MRQRAKKKKKRKYEARGATSLRRARRRRRRLTRDHRLTQRGFDADLVGNCTGRFSPLLRRRGGGTRERECHREGINGIGGKGARQGAVGTTDLAWEDGEKPWVSESREG